MEDCDHRDSDRDERQERHDEARVRPFGQSAAYSASVMAPVGQPFAAARTRLCCSGVGSSWRT